MRLLFLLLLSVLLAAGLGGAVTLHAPATDDERAAATPESIAYGQELLVQIAVSDLDAACAFYGDVMGLPLESRTESLEWARFILPTGARLGVGRQDEVKGSGTASVNISVRDIEAARRLLESRGVVFDGPTQVIPGVVRLADFSDPDGNRIRLAGAAR